MISDSNILKRFSIDSQSITILHSTQWFMWWCCRVAIVGVVVVLIAVVVVVVVFVVVHVVVTVVGVTVVLIPHKFQTIPAKPSQNLHHGKVYIYIYERWIIYIYIYICIYVYTVRNLKIDQSDRSQDSERHPQYIFNKDPQEFSHSRVDRSGQIPCYLRCLEMRVRESSIH